MRFLSGRAISPICRILSFLIFGVLGDQRSPYLKVVTNDAVLTVSVGQPPQIGMGVRFTTLLSEFVVIDMNCGKKESGCAGYCEDPTFALCYCPPLCHGLSPGLIALTCRHEVHRYKPHLSSTSQLISAKSWRPALYQIRPLYGSVYRETVQLENVWRSVRPRMSKLQTVNITLVSALLFDEKLTSEATGSFGLRPGSNSAAEEFMRSLGIERRVLTLAANRRFDTVKAHFDTGDMYATFGAEDRWRCVDWRWIDSPDFVLMASTVDFMGVEFHNVQIVFDLTNLKYRIPKRMADALVAAKILNVLDEEEGHISYNYRCNIDKPIRFLNASGQVLLQIGYQTETADDCISPVVVDAADMSSDPRAENLIIHMGVRFMAYSCLGYDYAQKKVGFAVKRLWAHPLYAVGWSDNETDSNFLNSDYL